MHTYGIVITFVIARDKNIFHRLCGQTLQAAKGDVSMTHQCLDRFIYV